MTRERIAELRRAGDERGDERINSSEVQEADFVLVAVAGLTWGELRELLDTWEGEENRQEPFLAFRQ